MYIFSIEFLIFFFTFINGQLLPTDPDYVSEMEKLMASAIRDSLGNNPAAFADLFRLTEKLQKRSDEHYDINKFDPLTTFRAVRSLVEEWRGISKMLKETISIKESKEIISRQLPNPKDIEEIVLSLFRIQDTYRLNTKNIASASVPGFNNTGALTAKECYEIGMIAFDKTDFYHSLSWLQEAGSRLEDEPLPTVGAIDVLAPLAISLEEKGNHKHAVRAAVWLSDLLDSGEGDKYEILRKYPKIENLMQVDSLDRGSIFREHLPQPKNERVVPRAVTKGSFEAPCRGDYSKVTHEDPKLTCHYGRQTPFLKVAPSKVEILNTKPLIQIYRGIITEKEINALKRMVTGKLQRARVGDDTNETMSYVSNERTSRIAWINPGDSHVADAIRKRAQTITGLNMQTAESLQMCSYGIGGHYLSHHDYSSGIYVRILGITGVRQHPSSFLGSIQTCKNIRNQKRDKLLEHEEVNGERIATLMYYLTEPEYGGATVFPYLQLTISPSQNDAIFWYNLKKSGEGIHDTLHGGCPVISGVKWVANQWINEIGQEFVRPCALAQDD